MKEVGVTDEEVQEDLDALEAEIAQMEIGEVPSGHISQKKVQVVEKPKAVQK